MQLRGDAPAQRRSGTEMHVQGDARGFSPCVQRGRGHPRCNCGRSQGTGITVGGSNPGLCW